MWNVRKIFAFGWRYLRPYRTRFFLGVLCGLLFAAMNGGLVWFTSSLTKRFAPESAAVAAAEPKPPAPGSALVPTGLKKRLAAIQDAVKAALDPWLPSKVGGGITWRHITGLLVLLPALAAIRGGLDYFNNYSMGWSSERAVRDLRQDLIEKLSKLSLDFFTRANTGDLLTRVNTDSIFLLQSFRSGAPDLVKEGGTLIAALATLLLLDWRLTLAVLIILPFCVWPMYVLGQKARKASRAMKAINVQQANQLVELIAGIRVIKAFNLEHEEIEHFRKKSGELVHMGMKNVQAKEMVGPIMEVIAFVALAVLLLYIFSTPASGANLPAFVLGFMLVFQAIRKLASVHVLFEQTQIGVERLSEIMEERPKVAEPAAPQPFTQFRAGLKFEHVSFGYLERPVLNGVNLEIPRGFKLGIAGESGSGKTTLVNLLFRFYDPTSGRVVIDGVDMKDIAIRDLRQQMALVSQEIVLFDETIAENIARGRPGATRADIEAAARAAFAHDFIMQQPQGYDTKVGERGVTLSVGQRQRVSIARAFVRNAPILVLDEATASLDSKAEAEVQAAIDRLAEHRTVVCIAHRLSTLSAMDKIIVVEAGRIIEQGSFNELVKAGGAFAAMARKQGIS